MNYLHCSIEVIFFFCFLCWLVFEVFFVRHLMSPNRSQCKMVEYFWLSAEKRVFEKKKSYPDKGFSKLQTRQLNGQLFIVALAPFSRSGDSKSIPSILVGSRKEDSTPVFYVVVAWSWVFCQIWVQIPKITERKFEQKLSS